MNDTPNTDRSLSDDDLFVLLKQVDNLAARVPVGARTFARLVIAADRALRAPQASMKWQPMAAAPKDGTEILLCTPGGQSDHYHAVFWDDDEAGPAWYSRYHDDWCLTEQELSEYHLAPMWRDLEPPPTSLCSG